MCSHSGRAPSTRELKAATLSVHLHTQAQGIFVFIPFLALYLPLSRSVPICLAGAKLTAEQILADAGIPVVWGGTTAYKPGRPSVGLDAVERPAPWWMVILVAVAMVLAYYAVYLRAL
jgi:hypothetical protein